MKTQRKHRSLVAGALAAAMLVGCASTEMTGTWTAPGAPGAALSRIAVIAMTQQEGLRRMAEDAAAAQLSGAQAVPSYQVLGDVDMHDAQAVNEKLEALGFQGVLVMRLTRVSENVVPVSAGPTFVGYYGWAAPMAYSPTYLQTETVVHMVTNLYSLKEEGKLIWSGASKTFDPASTQAVAADVAREVAKQLQKQHIVAG
jgi:hypothetical protein